MPRTKEVKFYYFKLKYLVDGDPVRLDLSDLLDGIRGRYGENDNRYSYEFDYEHSKLAYVYSPPEDNGNYQLTFERLRGFNYPVRTKLSGNSEGLGLEEDEFLGEEVTVLYDPQYSIMMIQNNRNSLSYKAIELFLNWLIRDNNPEVQGVISLVLQVENNPTRRVSRFIGFREVLLKTNIAVNGNNEGYVDDFIGKLQEDVGEYEADDFDVEIKITAKTKKTSDKPYLPQQIVDDMLSYEGLDVTKRLHVKGYDDHDTFTFVNLIENKLYDSHSFNFRENRQLNKDVVFNEMRLLYNEVGQNKIINNR